MPPDLGVYYSPMAQLFDPEILQARWVLGGLNPEDLVREALAALELGYTGIALQQLAGLVRPTRADLGTLPSRAFTDMGLKAINRTQAVDILLARGPASTPVLVELLNHFPAFVRRWRDHLEEWGGEPCGAYIGMSAFVHFVIDDLYERGNLIDTRRVFEMMEGLLAEGDQEARDLVGFGFFETLQNVASWRPYGAKAFKPFLGPLSHRAWVEIESAWQGKSSLADVIRAERQRG